MNKLPYFVIILMMSFNLLLLPSCGGGEDDDPDQGLVWGDDDDEYEDDDEDDWDSEVKSLIKGSIKYQEYAFQISVTSDFERKHPYENVEYTVIHGSPYREDGFSFEFSSYYKFGLDYTSYSPTVKVEGCYPVFVYYAVQDLYYPESSYDRKNTYSDMFELCAMYYSSYLELKEKSNLSSDGKDLYNEIVKTFKQAEKDAKGDYNLSLVAYINGKPYRLASTKF